MGLGKSIKAEGGSGGKRGHSNMSHWTKTAEVKNTAKKVRRKLDKELVRAVTRSPNWRNAE